MSDNQILKNKEFKLINFIMLTFAGIINAFGVIFFLFPVKLYDSGISGLSMLLDQVTPSFLTISLFLVIINIPLFLIGLKRQGVAFTVYSIYTVVVYSITSFLFLKILPINLNFVSPLAGTDLLLCAIFGGLISGIGSGLTIRFGGAIDGIDVLSVIFAKKLGISIGTFVMVFNLLLYIVCGIVLKSWILPLYSIITYFIGSKTIDYIVEGLDKSKCAMIVTKDANLITDALKDAFGSSGTIVNAQGGYSKNKLQILYFVVNRFQVNKLKKIVHEIDKEAFVSLQEVSDIFKKNK